MVQAGEDSGLRFAELPIGFEFDPVEFTISSADVQAYLEATGATCPDVPRAVVPPVSVAAFALRRLAGDLSLQPGSVHGGQEYEFQRAVEVGQQLVASSRVANRTRRQGTVIMIIEQEVRAGDEIVIKGRSTLAIVDDSVGPP